MKISVVKGVTDEVRQQLRAKAETALSPHGITAVKFCRGSGLFNHGGISSDEYYTITFPPIDSCPIKKLVAYRLPDGSLAFVSHLKERCVENTERALNDA